MENVLGNKETSTRAEAPSKTLGGCKVTELHTKGGVKTARGHQVKELWSQAHVEPQEMSQHGTCVEQRQGQAGIGGWELTCLCPSPFICLHHGKVPHAPLPSEIPMDVGFNWGVGGRSGEGFKEICSKLS